MTSKDIYMPILPTYLYIKQHSVTGLKYFGKTTRKNPYDYKGSGKRWKSHIKKHGMEHVITLWVSDLYIDTSITEHALHFSKENKIDSSPTIWANLKPENGLDGGSIKGFTKTDEQKLNQSIRQTGRKLKPKTDEQKLKHSVSMIGKNIGKIRTPEQNKRNSDSQRGKIMPPRTPEHCKKLSIINQNRSEEWREKLSFPKPKFLSIIETRKTYNKSNVSKYFPELKPYF